MSEGASPVEAVAEGSAKYQSVLEQLEERLEVFGTSEGLEREEGGPSDCGP